MHRDPLRAHARVRAAVVAVALLLVVPGVVRADAVLVSSVPAAGEVLATLPGEAVLTFNEPLTENSNFAIVDASGAMVATGAWDPSNPQVIRGPLPDLPPGIYEVQWAAASSDGHLPRGTFQFTVAQPTPPPPTPTAVTTDAPTAEPTPMTEPSPTPAPTLDPGTTTGGLDVVLPIAIVALLLGIGLAMLLRRRPA